jgi:hypothetical protein
MHPRMLMRPPSREIVTDIARSTRITTQTHYIWRAQWQMGGQLVTATARPPEQWSTTDWLAVVIKAADLSGADLWSLRRPLGACIATVRPPAQLHLPHP